MAGILHEFVQNTKILASQVNENFATVQNDMEELGSGINANLTNEITKAKSDLLADIETISNSKANANMDNITADTKSGIVKWGMPNFEAGTAKAWNTVHQATANGFLFARATLNDNKSFQVNIGTTSSVSTTVAYTYIVDVNNVAQMLVPIPKNYYYKISGTGANKETKFFPCLGG